MPFNNVMPQFKAGTLKSGSGQKVTNPKQAIAIMLSEKQKAAAGDQEYQAPNLMNALKKKKKGQSNGM
jgi:hypothetical protein